MKKQIVLCVAASLSILAACQRGSNLVALNQKAPKLPTVMDNYEESELPSGLKVGDNKVFIDPIFTGNIFPSNMVAFEVTNEGATLGRVLFYDKNLSLNNTVSCGSCHHQNQAFADGQATSRGFEGRETHRSSMAFTNPITASQLFWDSRSTSLVDLALRPVQNHIEMGMENTSALVKKLQGVNYYADLFTKAYGTPEITESRISTAIAQFVGSITSSESKFDKIMSPNSNVAFSTIEQVGHSVFTENCSSCHSIASRINPNITDGPSSTYGGGNNVTNGGVVFEPGTNNKDANGTTNIGLDLVYNDNGSGAGQFKIPSLRNITLTAPYMHDGRFANLDQVIEHYVNGIKPHKNLDPKLKTINGKKPIVLDEMQKVALKAFLNTLTDNEMIADSKFSDPFNY